MTDETQPAEIRTHKAGWTLGRIRSKAALPYLEAYYKNDPKGKTCQGNHEILICQYVYGNGETGRCYS